MISVIGVVLFIYIIYRTFTDGITVSNNYWKSPELFDKEGDTDTIYTLEWTQESPPRFHTYNELPYLVAVK
jgi:heme/copper-type cytochrome/quinol oxidase subunit 1